MHSRTVGDYLLLCFGASVCLVSPCRHSGGTHLCPSLVAAWLPVQSVMWLTATSQRGLACAPCQLSLRQRDFNTPGCILMCVFAHWRVWRQQSIPASLCCQSVIFLNLLEKQVEKKKCGIGLKQFFSSQWHHVWVFPFLGPTKVWNRFFFFDYPLLWMFNLNSCCCETWISSNSRNLNPRDKVSTRLTLD